MKSIESRISALEKKAKEQSGLWLVMPIEALYDDTIKSYFTSDPVGTLRDHYEGKHYKEERISALEDKANV